MSKDDSNRPSITEVISLPRSELLLFLSDIYEKSPWVAEEFCNSLLTRETTIETVRELLVMMHGAVDAAPREKRLELLKSHPDLCEKVENMAELTAASREEQGKAGLQTLTAEERSRFLVTNKKYRDKFGFPFILAVRKVSKYTVMSALNGRLGNSSDVEFAAALEQVRKIAWMRLLAAIDVTESKGFLTCHVLDTANGCPAAGMRVSLTRLTPTERSGLVGEFITNADGRLPGGPALKGDNFIVGSYEWTFYAGDYFASKGSSIAGQPFLDEVPIRFGIDDPDEHYHVPLLVSPWSFSTYRGS